eukprot:GILK01009837.1.p1 GENE.GILK01009837.1~~GILK01009837.1.p1  ORF type:complete len:177 (-),score=11.11 GILK01009837.1:124-615(-)
MAEFVVRPLATRDVPFAVQLQIDTYGAGLLIETDDIYQKKIDVFPEGCLGCFDNDVLIAYAMSHPWNSAVPVQLNEKNFAIPDHPDCYYIHDVAVNTSYRGKGVGHKLFARMVEVAKGLGFKKMKLVAVLGGDQFWAKFGFVAHASTVYGSVEDAVVMYKDLS